MNDLGRKIASIDSGQGNGSVNELNVFSPQVEEGTVMNRSLTGKRVFFVEDEMILAMGVERQLFDAGCDVVGPYGSVGKAMTAALTGGFDMALLDIDLHGSETYPVADVLAAQGIPFAFLSGAERKALPDRFAGTDMLKKPFRQPELLATLRCLDSATAKRSVGAELVSA